MHDPPRFRVHNLETIAPVVVPKIQEIARARLAVQFALPRDAMVRWLAERQNHHRRAAPEEYLVWGEHAAVCRGRGAVEPLRGPQDRLHPQARAIRVSNPLQPLQVHIREEPVDFNACRVPRLDCPRESALHWVVLLGRLRRRWLAAGSETVTVLHERQVGVLGAVVRPKSSQDSHAGHKPLYHTEDGRCALIPCPVWALEAGSAGSGKRCPRT